MYGEMHSCRMTSSLRIVVNLASSSSSRISFMAMTTPDVVRPLAPPLAEQLADVVSRCSSDSVPEDEDCRAAGALKLLNP